MAVMTSFLSLLEPLSEVRPAHRSLQSDAGDGSARSDAPGPSTPDMAERSRQTMAAAEETLALAQAAAAEMREDAQIQAEAFRAAAWQEGFYEGGLTARERTEAKLRAQWDAERADFRAQAQALLDGIVAQRQALWEGQEAEMVRFVLDVARQVIKTEVAQNPEIVTHVLHNAMRRITDKEHVRIRVSVGDAARIRETRDDLLTLVDGIKHLEILDDRRVGDGGCVIETGAGTIDAKIETQMDEVERALNHAIEG